MTDDRPGRELITLDDGREAWHYPATGMIKDCETGYIVQPPISTQIKNPAEASAMASARWDNYRTRAELGAAAGARRESSLDAWQWVVEKQTELAGDVEKGRASTEAARFVAQSLDAIPDRRSQTTQNGGITIEIGAEVARQLVEIARNRAANGSE